MDLYYTFMHYACIISLYSDFIAYKENAAKDFLAAFSLLPQYDRHR
jgi:hypothetical protein